MILMFKSFGIRLLQRDLCSEIKCFFIVSVTLMTYNFKYELEKNANKLFAIIQENSLTSYDEFPFRKIISCRNMSNML